MPIGIIDGFNLSWSCLLERADLTSASLMHLCLFLDTFAMDAPQVRQTSSSQAPHPFDVHILARLVICRKSPKNSHTPSHTHSRLHLRL